MLVDPKSKSLINVFTVRLVNHRLGKGFFCAASRLFDSFRNSECIILLLWQKPNFPKLRKAPRNSYVPPSSATCIGFFFFGADQSAMSSGLQYGKDIGLGEINTKHARLQREAPNPRRMRRNRKQERKVRMGLTLRKFPCPSTLSLLPPSHTTGRRRRPGQPN